jgi:hypothetical protein
MDAGDSKCAPNQYARFYDYIEPLATSGRFSAYFECVYMGDVIE